MFDVGKRYVTSLLIDPEVELIYMQNDHVSLEGLIGYIREKEQHPSDPYDRLRLMVRYSLGVMKQRIAKAKATFYARHPQAWTINFYCNHLNEDTLMRYFSGRITRREMSSLESDCRYCPQCGWELVGVGETLRSFGALFGCDQLLSPIAVRTSHLDAKEIGDWLRHRQSHRKKREVLDHLKICLRCLRRMRREAGLQRWLKSSW